MAAVVALPARLFAQARGEIRLEFVDQAQQQPLVARVKIESAEGRPQRVRGALYQQGWNLFEQPLSFAGRPGIYTYQAFHGPQFSRASGGFTLDARSEALEIVRLPRHADVLAEGWLAGDLLSHVVPQETQRWLAAEDLHLAVVLSETNAAVEENVASSLAAGAQSAAGAQQAAWVEQRSHWDARDGSGLVLHHWQAPAAVPAELPSSRLLVLAKRAEVAPQDLPVHAEIQKLWARDVPIWLASGLIDSVQLLSSHLTVDGQRAEPVSLLVEAEPGRFRGAHLEARLAENLYWQMLECGLRLPPTAGSGFGRNGSPLGYNRVYAHAPLATSAAWWQAVRVGQSFVTNGPLLRATVNGELPGKEFQLAAGQGLAIELDVQLTVAEPVEYLEVVFNAQSLYRAPLDEFARAGGVIPPLEIRESGWLLVRVVTELEQTYRLACTAPFYFEVAGAKRVSGRAVEFFQRWLEGAAEQIAARGPTQAHAAETYLAAAKQFWTNLRSQATAP